MTLNFPKDLRVILIAPNVSEQMGGEGTKALHIYREISKRGIDVIQVLHERCIEEVRRVAPDIKTAVVEDTPLQKFLWSTRIFRPIVPMLFNWYAAKKVKQLLIEHSRSIVHYTAPVSPVKPHFSIHGAKVVIGPQNGNIYNPPAFRTRDHVADTFRRLSHPWLQRLNRLLFRGKRNADVLLVAGGHRTEQSLLWAGCRKEQFIPCNDSGVLTSLADRPLIHHSGTNFRFVHNGRLVSHKGTDLAIKALQFTKQPIVLDVYGKGPFEEECKSLTRQLGLDDRVHFRGWVADHSKLPEVLSEYRGFVFPSLAEANGIVVQEAMMMGLPTICLDWGGPELLIDQTCGFAIEPRGEDYVIREIAKSMDALATDSSLANRLAMGGRDKARREGYLWSDIVDQWIAIYLKLDTERR